MKALLQMKKIDIQTLMKAYQKIIEKNNPAAMQTSVDGCFLKERLYYSNHILGSVIIFHTLQIQTHEAVAINLFRKN